MNLQATQIQLALFSPGVNLSDRLSLASNIRENANQYYDGETVILPVPDDAPTEIPRIVLRSKDDQYSLNISPQKVDIFFKPKAIKGKKNSVIAALSKASSDYLSQLSTFLIKPEIMSVNRVGVVIQIVQVQEDLLVETTKAYLNSRFAEENWDDFSINLLRKEQLDGLQTNKWFRLNMLNQGNGSEPKNLVYLLDLNTERSEKNNFSASDVSSFRESALISLSDYFNKVAG